MSEKFLIDINRPEFKNLSGTELTGFSFLETLDGCARWSLIFSTQRQGDFDDLIKNDETEFTLRIGTRLNPSGPQYSTQKTVRILRAQKMISAGRGVTFNFKGACSGIKLQRHRAKDKQWEDKRISEIVQELVDDVGLESNVQRTEGKFSLMGCNLPTAQFINRQLLPLAYARRGNDWRLWVEDGKTVRFEPLRPLGSSTLRFTNTFRENWIKLRNPKVVKDTLNEARRRRGKIEVMMYDSDRDRLIRNEVGERRGQFQYLSSRGRPVEREHVSESIRVNYQRDRQTNLRPDKLVRQMGQNIWGRHARSLYRLIGEVGYEPGIRVNTAAIVDLVGAFQIPDQNSGVWVVQAVKHTYSRGQPRSWVALEKRWEA